MPQTLGEWLARLEQLHPSEIELGLDRVGEVATRMGLALADSKVVTVAGTNGKGSTVALVRDMLMAHGFTTATYTSPHLSRFNERICIDGQPQPDELICRALAIVDSARGDTSLTYFEFTTLAALWIFQQARPHYCVLEVGLGGRLDAVNIIDPDITVVTNIDLDHQAWLGQDLDSIAREKAGIFRANTPAICGQQHAPAALREVADSVGAMWSQAGAAFSLSADEKHWQWRGCDLDGRHYEVEGQRACLLAYDNVAAALQVALYCLDQPQTGLLAGVASEATVPGRCQYISLPIGELVLDVAHNPAAAARLAEYLAARPIKGKTSVVFAMLADKSCDGFIGQLQAQVDGSWWLPVLDHSRAMAPASIVPHLVDAQTTVSVADSLQQARALMTNDDRLVVTGSFMTVAAALAYLQEEGIGLE